MRRQKAEGRGQKTTGSMTRCSAARHFRPLPSSFCPGFTLTELLIVIALIVLLIALAIPALDLISGSRSIEGAQNQIAAMLGRARAEAIGLQEFRGVFFFLDPNDERIKMTLVRETVEPHPSTLSTDTDQDCAQQVDVWLDLVPDAEFIALPSGVGLQVISESIWNASSQRVSDGYVGFNDENRGNGLSGDTVKTRTLYGGVILFDASGRLAGRRYAFRSRLQNPTGGGFEATAIGKLLYKGKNLTDPTGEQTAVGIAEVVPEAQNPAGLGLSNARAMRSQFGFVLFDQAAFREAFPESALGVPGFRREMDWEIRGVSAYNTAPVSEDLEEKWLDENSVQLLINRYNGTLIKGE